MNINCSDSKIIITPTDITNKYVSIYLLQDINSNITPIDLSFDIKDGYYKIYELIIPKLKYLNIEEPNTFLRYPNFIVYYNNEICQYLPESNTVKSLDYNSILQLDSNIEINQFSSFSYQNLENCLQEYIKSYNDGSKLEDLNQPNCADCRNISKDDLLNRINCLTTILSMVEYFVQCMNYLEAQKLIDSIPYCNVRRENN